MRDGIGAWHGIGAGLQGTAERARGAVALDASVRTGGAEA